MSCANKRVCMSSTKEDVMLAWKIKFRGNAEDRPDWILQKTVPALCKSRRSRCSPSKQSRKTRSLNVQ